MNTLYSVLKLRNIAQETYNMKNGSCVHLKDLPPRKKKDGFTIISWVSELRKIAWRHYEEILNAH